MIKVFSHWIHWTTVFQIVLDVVFPFTCVLSAVFWAAHGGRVNLEIVFTSALIFALVMILFNSWLGFYQRAHSRSAAQTRARTALSLYLSVPLAYGVFALLSMADVKRELLLVSGLAALFGILAHRVYMMHSRTGAMTMHRVLIIGSGPEAESIARGLERSDPDMQIVGFYSSPIGTELHIPRQLVLSSAQSLLDTAYALKVDEIIIAVQDRRGGILPLRELLDCRLSGIKVIDLASYYQRELGQIRLDSLKAGWLIFGDGFRQGWGRTLIKRLFDIVAATTLLILALPVMLVSALLIVREDGFPVFYRQERVGLNGKLFKVVKFRSMRKDAEGDGKPRWAAANDDRTTRVGRIIRKLRIDELPQLYCVLAGDMSLVGPRPERPYFVDQLTRDIPFYAVRHSVKPGVTGWAQVSYHYGASVEDAIQKLQYDLYYVKNHTLFLDLVIVFETVGVVLSARGAH